MINIKEQQIRFTVLLGGRPFKFEYRLTHDDFTLQIFHEDKNIQVVLSLLEKDLALSDAELSEKFLNPALLNLDGVAFPERMERFIVAMKEYALIVKRSLAA